MKIIKRIKTEEGIYEVDAEFSESEMDFIVEAGLNYLLKIGALPFIAAQDEDLYKVVSPSQVEN